VKKLNYKDIVKKARALLHKKPERLGIHLEGSEARIVRLAKSPQGVFKLEAFERVAFNLAQPTIEQQRDFVRAVARVGGGLQKVAVNVEDPSLKIRRMVFPKMPDGDVREAIRWNFRENIEVPIEEYVVGFSPLQEIPEEGKIAVMAFGVSRKAIANYAERVKALGLKLVSLEPAATAILAAFTLNGVLNDDKYHVCVVYGESISIFTVMKGSELLFSRPLPNMCQGTLKKNLVRDVGVPETKIEEMLALWIKQSPSDSSSEEWAKVAEGDFNSRFMASMTHFYSNFVIEIQRSIDAFCIQYDVEQVDLIHVCDIGVRYPGLVRHIERTLGHKAKACNPFVALCPPDILQGSILDEAPSYVAAVGLALP